MFFAIFILNTLTLQLLYINNMLVRSTGRIVTCLWVSPQNFRMLENRLDKFQFKCKEAEKCKMINMKLKAQMQVGG